METLWFALLGFMLTTYVVLDGFDLGAGALHLFLARNDGERRAVLAAIGPLWDGNEVWLVASGGVLVFAFPRAYASAFSGFYLPLMMVLWLLVTRGLSIELRSQHPSPLWRAFWDAAFGLASALIAVVLGAALGNLVRGVPVEADGYFHSTLFAGFWPGTGTGALDAYTVWVGVFALAVLCAHGTLFLAWKTEGALEARCLEVAPWLWGVVALLGVGASVATARLQPDLVRRFLATPVAWPFGVIVAGAAVWIGVSLRRKRALPAFVGSALLIAGMLGGTAAAMFPLILRSTLNPQFNLDAYNASSGRGGLRSGLAWWIPAIVLAGFYFVFLFRFVRGKTGTESGHG